MSETTRRKHFLFPYADMMGPYCHPLHVQSSPDSSCLLTMLTTREGSAAASAPKHAEDDGKASDVGVNDLGDDGEAMCALRRSQPWETEEGGPTCAGFGGWRKIGLKKHDRL